jgi:hypothetical protein
VRQKWEIICKGTCGAASGSLFARMVTVGDWRLIRKIDDGKGVCRGVIIAIALNRLSMSALGCYRQPRIIRRQIGGHWPTFRG